MTFIERTDIFSPPLVRLLAREKNGKPLTTAVIAGMSGLSPHRVELIAETERWDDIRFEDMCRFLFGCGLKGLDDGKTLHRLYCYLRFAGRPKTIPFRYLRNDPSWKTYYLPLIIKWRKSYGDITNQPNIYRPLRQLLLRLTPLIK